MTIFYPLTLPTVTKLTGFMLRELNVVGVTKAPFSGLQQVQQFPGQWWEASFDIRPLNYDEFRQWGNFFSQLNGQAGTFAMGHPMIKTISGNALSLGGLPQIDGGNQSGNTLAIKTGLGNLTNFLKAGDLFSIGLNANRRMYKTLADVSLIGGKAIMDIWPKLRYPPIDNDLLYFTFASTQWRMTVNSIESSITGSDGLYRIPTVECIEAF
jgi:hypothetical protein